MISNLPPPEESSDRAGSRRDGVLDRRPGLQRLSSVLWSSFIGAALSATALALVPEDFTLPPRTPGGAAIVFIGMWVLALVPALFASILASPLGRSPEDAR